MVNIFGSKIISAGLKPTTLTSKSYERIVLSVARRDEHSTTLFDASSTCTIGDLYFSAILTAVCCLLKNININILVFKVLIHII